MPFDDRFADRKSEPGAGYGGVHGVICPEELGECLCLFVLVHANSLVFHRTLEGRPGALCRKGNFTAIGREFDRVGEEASSDLGHLFGVQPGGQGTVNVDTD